MGRKKEANPPFSSLNLGLYPWCLLSTLCANFFIVSLYKKTTFPCMHFDGILKEGEPPAQEHDFSPCAAQRRKVLWETSILRAASRAEIFPLRHSIRHAS